MKKKKQRLNDGFAAVYWEKDNKTDFNADIRAKTLDDLEYVMDMAYEEQFKREQDYEFAESSGHSLNLKVKMRLYEKISKKNKIVIEDVLYNILKIDYSKSEKCMYLYLEEERKIAQ